MKISGTGKLLRIFIGENDKANGKPLYEAIVLEARQKELAGATVIKGVAGFGASSRMHTAKILRLSEDLPVVIEIIDTEEKLREFIPVVDDLFEKAGCGGLLTLELAEIVKYSPKGSVLKP